jgi:hypothetical protein
MEKLFGQKVLAKNKKKCLLPGVVHKKGGSQGCQMVYFQTKNPNLGKFLRALDWNIFYGGNI